MGGIDFFFSSRRSEGEISTFFFNELFLLPRSFPSLSFSSFSSFHPDVSSGSLFPLPGQRRTQGAGARRRGGGVLLGGRRERERGY